MPGVDVQTGTTQAAPPRPTTPQIARLPLHARPAGPAPTRAPAPAPELGRRAVAVMAPLMDESQFRIWKTQLVPLIYDWFSNHNLTWPTQACR